MKRRILREDGSALFLAMVLIVAGTLLVMSVLFMTAYQTKASTRNRDWTNARYLAESVAKNQINAVITTVQNNGFVITQNMLNSWNFTNRPVSLDTGSGLLSSTATVSPNLTKPTSLTVDLTVRYTVNGATYTVRPRVLITIKWTTTPGVTELFAAGDYRYSGGDWSNNGGVYNPSSDSGSHLVEFVKNTCAENELHLSYTARCTKETGTGGGGLAIIYGLTDDSTWNEKKPNQYQPNPDGYTFQYDPGAGPSGSFFVKRLKKQTPPPSSVQYNEWWSPTAGNRDPNGNLITNPNGIYYNDNLKPSGSAWWPIPFEPNTPGVAGPNDTDNLVRVDLRVNGDWNKLSLEKMMYEYARQDHIAAGDISESDARNAKEFYDWCTSHGKTDWLFNYKGTHTIRIDVVNDRHYIYCDGKLILEFTDVTGYKKSMKGTYTGVRSWECFPNFQSNPSIPVQDQAPAIIWRR